MIRPIPAICLCLLLGACAARQTPPPEPSVPLPAAPPSGEPAGLEGLSAANLRAAFGKPSFERKENGAEFWRYDGSACHAFFFLYPENGALVVRHVETVPGGADSASDPTCLAALRGKPS
jgi:hypothetical protein